MQIILSTINCHTQKQPMVISLVSRFFNGHCIESLSAINLYSHLMTSMVLSMVVESFNVYFQFYPAFRGCMFSLRPRYSVFPDFMQTRRILGFFCRRYTKIFLTFLLLSFRHAQNFSEFLRGQDWFPMVYSDV